jgi:predicted ferric reductase
MTSPDHDIAAASPRGLRLAPRALGPLYILACAAPLILAATRNAAPASPWEIAAAALGMVGLAAMAVQAVTSGRFELVSGRLGIDRVMAFHKVAAWWVLLALLLHPVIYVVPTWQADPALAWERLWAYHTLPHYRSGVIALAALSVLVVGSALRERLPLRYEVWRGAHVVLSIVALGAGLHHAITVGRFGMIAGQPLLWWGVAAAVVAVLLVLYGWRWARLHRRPWRLASVTRHPGRMWELDIQPEAGTPALGYTAGQFVWMTEGARRFPLFDHPFSIADSPTRPGLSLIIKEAGDFTDRIGDLPPGTAIGIDGPYGDFTLEAHRGDAVLLIAGGVGIAPIMGLLRDLVAQGDARPIRLAYAAGQPGNFACLPEIEAARATLDLDVLLVSEEPAADWSGDVGRLDHDRLGRLLHGLDPARTVALMCGPGPMVTAVSDGLVALGMPMDHVIYERFDYGGGASRIDRRRRGRFVALGGGVALVAALFVAVMA